MKKGGVVLLLAVLFQLPAFTAEAFGRGPSASFAGQFRGRERSIALCLRTGREKYVCIQGDRVYYYCLMNGSQSSSAGAGDNRCILVQPETRAIILKQ